MKIGLITYHESLNNGAMLQAYATCRALQQLGHEVQIVDIHQPEIIHTNPIVNFIVSVVYCKRQYETRKFRKRFYAPLTRRYRTIDELRQDPPDVDCLVVGSDQVWNPKYAGDTLMAYFLDFGGEDVARISYASSFGVNEWPQNQPDTAGVQKSLDKFIRISTREESGVKILRETFNKEARLVVDPTMLFSEHNLLAGTIKPRNEVVCYKLYRNQEFFQFIGGLKEKTGLPLRLLNNAFPVKGMRYTYPPSVAEWIRRIGGARYVVTDSFHGVVFSLLYKRDFVAIKNHNGMDARMIDLLTALNLGNRLYENTEAINADTSWLAPIDYSLVEKKLERLREDSWEYLRTALNSCKCYLKK